MSAPFVSPANAGVPCGMRTLYNCETPAFAGVTGIGE